MNEAKFIFLKERNLSMLKKVDGKKENMTTYFLGGEFLVVFDELFKNLDEDVEVYLETPKGIMASVLVSFDSKYDDMMLDLYNNYVDGVAKTWDKYPELTRDELFGGDFMKIMLDRDIVSCKVV